MLLHMWDAQGSFPFQHVPAVLGGGPYKIDKCCDECKCSFQKYLDVLGPRLEDLS